MTSFVTLITASLPTHSNTLDALQQGKLFHLEGSNTIGQTLAPTWVKAWMEHRGMEHIQMSKHANKSVYRISAKHQAREVFVDIIAEGSSKGIKGLITNNTDIAMSSRKLKASEVKQLAEPHSGAQIKTSDNENIVAIDGLAIIAHPRNPINTLDLGTIQKIFSGEIKDWKQLGGLSGEISVHSRNEDSGTFHTFESLVLKDKKKLIKNAEHHSSNKNLAAAVSQELSAIGFVAMAYAGKAKALAISDSNNGALSPEPLHVATEDYPLTRRLYMYTANKGSNPNARNFIEFTVSKQGQQFAKKLGFVSQNPIKTKVEGISGPEDYEKLIKNGERLSVNFRFEPGHATLDSKAQQDVLRVVDFLNYIEGDDVHIKLVGFSNTRETSTRADVLSRLRANAVKIALFRHGIDTDQVLGFGADVLVANNEGRQSLKNDRVEVWVVSNGPS